jgi:leucyl-tRNA synthetase
MELTNNLYLIEPKLSTNYEKMLFRECLLSMVKLLTPFTPHMCEELWQLVGKSGFVSQESWPAYEEKYTVKDEVTLAIQVNGKVRAEITLPRDVDKDTAISAAKGNEKIMGYLEGKTIVKEIYVPQKLISLVIK